MSEPKTRVNVKEFPNGEGLAAVVINGTHYGVLDFRADGGVMLNPLRGWGYLSDGLYKLKDSEGNVRWGKIAKGYRDEHDVESAEFFLLGELEPTLEHIEARDLVERERGNREIREIKASLAQMLDQDEARGEEVK
jgi:hypothetical protein